MKEFTLITGGASGLGYELAKLFAAEGHNLFLVSSSRINLEAAKDSLEKEFNIEVLILDCDLSDLNSFSKVKEYTDKLDVKVTTLVNNAGFGDRADFVDMDIEKQIRMNNLNCSTPIFLIKTYLQDMIENKGGNILNISSIAGFMPGPYMSTYHSSKAYMLYQSGALHIELKKFGINVTAVCPGPFDSDFVKKAHNDYTFKKIKPMTTKKVALLAFKALKKKKMTYIIGFKNKLTCFVTRFFPRKMIASIAAGTMKEK
jgi:short-subunit dehydrogenase